MAAFQSDRNLRRALYQLSYFRVIDTSLFVALSFSRFTTKARSQGREKPLSGSAVSGKCRVTISLRTTDKLKKVLTCHRLLVQDPMAQCKDHCITEARQTRLLDFRPLPFNLTAEYAWQAPRSSNSTTAVLSGRKAWPTTEQPVRRTPAVFKRGTNTNG